MKVHELIAKLKNLPQDVEVYTSSTEGCPECNPECFEHYASVIGAEYHEPQRAPYPNHDIKKSIVVIS